MQNKKIIEFLSFLSIFFLLILVSSGQIRVIYRDMSLRAYSMYLWINGGLGLILYVCNKIMNPKFNKFEIIILIMILLSFLSLTNAVNLHVALVGKSSRYEGLFVWLTYYIIMLNAMNIKNKKYLYIIITMISLCVFGNIIYGLFQVGLFGETSLLEIKGLGNAAQGFLGNSMCFASLSGIFYGLILGLFIKVKVGKKKYILAIILLLANLMVVMSASMSAIAGVIVINLLCLVEGIVLLIKKKENRFRYLTSFIIGALSFVLVFFLYSNHLPTVKSDVEKMFNEASEGVNGNFKDNYGTGRIYIWKETINKMKEGPITGYGIDNFAKAFDYKLLDPVHHGMVDKAHNDYLQKSFCEGIIAGILFIVFLLMIFFKGIFKNLSPIYYGLLLSFTCYSVIAFFNISVIRVAPIYFIVIGLLLGKISEEKENKIAI